jgi:hypothetical protein
VGNAHQRRAPTHHGVFILLGNRFDRIAYYFSTVPFARFVINDLIILIPSITCGEGSTTGLIQLATASTCKILAV